MEIERTFVGLDVHARSVVACALDDVTGELIKGRLVLDSEEILVWLRQLPGPVAVVYEVGPTGFGWPGSCWRTGSGGWSRHPAATPTIPRPAGTG